MALSPSSLIVHWWQLEVLSVWSVRAWLSLQEETLLQWGYKVVLLHVQGMDVDHTVQNTAAMIQSSLREWFGDLGGGAV